MTDTSRRRRIIYTSFRGVVSDEQALKAVRLWDSAFADVPAFSALRFLRSAKEAMGLSSEHVKLLMQRINQNLEARPEHLEPDPLLNGAFPHAPASSTMASAQPPANRRASARSRPQEKSAQQLVFEFMLSNLLNRVWHLRTDLLADLAETDLSTEVEQMLRTWASSTTPDLVIPSLRQEEMSGVLDLIYGWYCDVMGPAATDLTFNQVIAQAQALPEAALFSPRKFL